MPLMLALLALLPLALATPLPIGCNVEGLSYYDEDLKVCDLVHSASPFGLPEGPWKGSVAVDAAGWPLADFSVILYDGANALEEQWVVTGSGPAPAITGVACSVRVSNVTHDPAANTFAATIDTAGSKMVTLAFGGTAGGVQNLRVWRASCSDAAAVFHPAYLAHVSRCSLLRFLDFAQINNDNKTSWAGEKPLAYPQWSAGGAPWAAAIALANAVAADVWINIPTLADDAYVAALAGLLQQQLRPSALIYTEFSNEVWNFGFQQAGWVTALANASVLRQGDPYRLNYLNESNEYYWANRLTAYNAAIRIPRIFAGVFGAGSVGRGARVRPVLAGQVAFAAPIEQGLRYLESVWGAPSALLHALAGAPYFGAGTAGLSTVPQLLARVAESVAGLHPSAGWGAGGGAQQHATLAAWHRLYFHGYEGGPDFSHGGSNYTLTGAAQRDPGFTPLMTQYYLNWAAYGNAGPLNQFEAGASDWNQQFGCWGLAERISDATSTKLAAFDAARSAARPANALGIPVPTAGFPAGYFAGCSAPNASAAGALGMHGGQPPVLYPLNLAGQAAGATLSVAIAEHYSAGVVEVGLNGRGAQNVTLPGVARFALAEEDVGGDFGGVAALSLRGVTLGAYYVIDNLTFTTAPGAGR